MTKRAILGVAGVAYGGLVLILAPVRPFIGTLRAAGEAAADFTASDAQQRIDNAIEAMFTAGESVDSHESDE